MTTAMPAGVHRPPSLSLYAAPISSLKRQTSTAATGSTADTRSRLVEEAPISKRQKVKSSSPAFPPSVPASSDPCPVNANAHKLARAQDAKRLPLELTDGFFVGSEGVHDGQPRSAGAVHSSPPSLPHRPWKHTLPAHAVTEGILNNSGVRRRNDMQVQSVPCKTEPPQDAPMFMTERECGNNNPYQL